MSLPSYTVPLPPQSTYIASQPGVFGHLASPINLSSPGTSQRQSRRHLTNAWVAETRGCPREKGRWVSGCGQGAPEDAQGPGRQLARRAGGRHLSVRAPLPPRATDWSPVLHWPWRGGFPAAVPSDQADCRSGRQLHSLQPPKSCQPPGLQESASGAWL